MLLIEPFIGIHAHLVDNDEPFFPSSEDLRFLEYFSINETVFYNRFRHSRDTLLERVKLHAHHFELTGNY